MNKNDVTIIIVTSVLPSHPDTTILDETIREVRIHFPENEIILQIDGLREERLNRKADYDEFKNRVLWKCLHEWKNVLPIIFDEHSHQTTMMKETIGLVQTSAMLYVEGDAPITGDRHIDWEECLDMLEFGEANTIRFHFEAFIPTDHIHLMLEKKGNFLQTIQWSQRPHLSLVKYYEDVVLPSCRENFFIEDTFHGKVQDDIMPYDTFSKNGWNIHKLWIYHPEGDIKRSYHLDGRAGTRKFTSDDEAWGLTE
jgi:hypothetical protein